MQRSMSATVLPSHLRQTIANRGSHDVGTVVGLPQDGDDVYVPRALWTEAVESPLKVQTRKADWDPDQFLKEEKLRTLGRERKKTYLLGQYTRQWGETAQKTATLQAEKKADGLVLTTAIQKKQEDLNERAHVQKESEKFVVEANKVRQREIAQHARNQRLREAQELVEIKMRTAQELNSEMLAQQRTRDILRTKDMELFAQRDGKRQRERDERSEEIREQQRFIREAESQDERRTKEQQRRFNATLDVVKRSGQNFEATAGKTDADRVKAEGERQERDELRHNMKVDKHYATREGARAKMQQNMVSVLSTQKSVHDKRSALERQMMAMESEAIDASVRNALRREFEKQERQLEEEKRVQGDLIHMMADRHYQEERDQYKRPTNANTMSDLAAATRKHRRSGRTQQTSQVQTSPKRAEVKPWVDISRPPGIGPVGIFVGDGGSQNCALKATGGMRRIVSAAA